MKALADANGDTGNRDYKILKQGYPVQERLAKDLHRLAGVPEGLCGIFKPFWQLSPGYQINVMSIDPPHMIAYVRPTPSKKFDTSHQRRWPLRWL